MVFQIPVYCSYYIITYTGAGITFYSSLYVLKDLFINTLTIHITMQENAWIVGNMSECVNEQSPKCILELF